MNLTEYIQNGLRYNTQKLQGICEQLSQDELFFQPYGNVNHLVWQLGHLMFVRNTMIKLLNGEEKLIVLPTERQLFGPGCKIEAPENYPALSELLAHFASRGERISALLGTVTAERLAEESFLKLPNMGVSYGQQVHSFYIHECNHLGEINVLKNIVAKNRESLFV
jgi:hypothetical protein